MAKYRKKNRPSRNPTNYTYSCSARRDESNGITFSLFGDDRKNSEKVSKLKKRETQSELVRVRASPRREREKKLFSQIHFFFSKTRRARRDESFGITFRAFGDGRLFRSFQWALPLAATHFEFLSLYT